MSDSESVATSMSQCKAKSHEQVGGDFKPCPENIQCIIITSYNRPDLPEFSPITWEGPGTTLIIIVYRFPRLRCVHIEGLVVP